MRNLKHLSIKNKIVFMYMTITVIMLSIIFFWFVNNEIERQKKALIINAELDAKIVNEAVYASLDFKYKLDAKRVLKRMSVKPYLYDFIIFDNDNNYFVSLKNKKTDLSNYKFAKKSLGHYFTDDYLYFKTDILNEKKIKVGSILSMTSTKIYKERISSFKKKLIFLLIIIILLSFFLSNIMQRFITNPILHLANTTKAIKEKEDLNIEVEYNNEDAIGMLYKNFNELITAIREKEELRKIAEKEQKTLQLQLQQSQKMEAVGQLAGGIAHDFNNILTAINGYADLAIVRAKEDKSLVKMIKIIRESGQRASNLTNQLLTFSRKQVIDIKKIALNEVIVNMHKMLLRIIEEDTKLKINCEEECYIDADKGQIEQIIMNLVVNARDAIRMNPKTKKDKLIEIETKIVEIEDYPQIEFENFKAGKYVSLILSDSGVGIDIDTKDKIFEPFFTTKARGKGTGLGLATVYGIVKQNKGSIHVYSEKNIGTTFKIYWPLSYSDKSDQAEVIDKKNDNIKGGNESILIVEDDDNVLSLIKSSLSIYGYKIFTAKNGEDALAVSEKSNFSFDLILTDVIMPGMSGPDFVNRYKKRNPRINIIYTSGYTFDKIMPNGVLDKDINFIRKPYNVKDIAIKIREILDSHKDMHDS